jgi:hypothetical protein
LHVTDILLRLLDWGSLNSSTLTHDWTALDPAIVTGQLAADRADLLAGRGLQVDRADLLAGRGLQPDRADLLAGRGLQPDRADLLLSSLHHLQSRADSPPNWITANLEALTSDPLSYGGGSGQAASSLIPAFSSLGLGGAGSARGGLLGGGRSQLGGGGWGSGGSSSGGSSTATPPPGFSQHRAAAGPLAPPHYTGFGLAKGSEAQKIGGEFTEPTIQ